MKQQLCNLLQKKRGIGLHQMLIFLFTTAASSVLCSKPFQPVRLPNGSYLCAVDTPSYSLSISDINGIPDGVPDAVRCSFQCTTESCSGFNYVIDNQACQFYDARSRDCTAKPNCFYYQELPVCKDAICQPGIVAWILLSQCPPSLQVVSADSCSFPFTLNGQLYYQCALDNNKTCDVGCYLTGRVWASCKSDAKTSYVAHNSTVSVPIPPAMNYSVPMRSVAGWLTILSRIDSQFPLNLYWHNYSIGFGDIRSNFWLGLEKIYQLTTKGGRTYRLRVEVQSIDTEGWYSEEYDLFYIDSEAQNYTLHVSTSATGDAGDAINCPWDAVRVSNGAPFSTRDVNSVLVANVSGGGWWMLTSSSSRLMGYTLGSVPGHIWAGLNRVGVTSNMGRVMKSRLMIKAID